MRELNSNQKLIISIMILSTSWLFFLLDNKMWYQVVNYFGNQPLLTQTIFLYSFSIFMFVGTRFIKEDNIKNVGLISILNIWVIVSLIKFIPVIQVYYIVYILLGAVAGLIYSVIFYFGIYGFPSEIRIKEIAIFLFGSYLMQYFYDEILKTLGFNYLYPVFVGVIFWVIILFCRVDLEKLVFPNSSEEKPFAWKRIVLLDLVLFILFFIAFLVSNGTRVLQFTEETSLVWFSRIIRLLIFGVFYFINPYLARMLYTSLICIIMAFVLNLMPLGGNIAFVFFDISDALRNCFIFTVIAEVSFKQGRRVNVLSLLILSVAAAVIFGTNLGMVIDTHLAENYVLFYGAFAILFCSTLLILPWLLKLISIDRPETGRSGLLSGIQQAATEEKILLEKSVSQEFGLVERLKIFNSTLPEERRLTVRELEIACLLLQRYDYKTIADQLYISVNTLKVHVKHIYQKYEISGKKELIELIELQCQREKTKNSAVF